MDGQTDREGRAERETEGKSFKKTGYIIAYDIWTTHLIVQILKIWYT